MFLFLVVSFCKWSIKDEEIEFLGNVIKNNSIEDSFKEETPSNYFFKFFTKSFQEENRLSSILDLACAGEAKKYVYASNVISNTWLHDEDSKVAEYLVEIAKLCAEEYLDNPYETCPKTDYYYRDETLDNLKSILILTKALDKKAIHIFFNLLDSKRMHPAGYLDLLTFLSRNKVYRAFGYLGDIYYYGLGVAKSVDRAMDLYLKGKSGGDPVSYNGIGRILMSSEYEDYGSAKNHFELASMAGILNETDYRLYELYTNHLFMVEYGKFYLSKAMSMGFLPAIAKDGLGYYSRKDYASTIIRLEPILDYSRPVIDLQNKANAYYKNKNYFLSLVSHLVAVELGSRSSLDNAIYLLENHQLLRDQDYILFNLYIRQMREGVNKNLNRIGDCYYYGRGVKQSYTDAFSYYLSSSVFKNTEGIVSVSHMYEKGLGVERDVFKSLEFLRRIRVDDKNYLLLIYIYIFFFFKLVVLNKYVLGSVLGGFIIFRVFNKYNKVD